MCGVELADKANRGGGAGPLPRRRLIVLLCGPEENVLRLIPPHIADESSRRLDILSPPSKRSRRATGAPPSRTSATEERRLPDGRYLLAAS